MYSYKKTIKVKLSFLKPKNNLIPELFKLGYKSHQKSEKSLRRKFKIETQKNTNKEFDK